MDLGLDVRGVAAASSWSLDVSVLRNWVKKLRGICTHPQVGQLASQKDRWLKAGSGLKSIAEVLEVCDLCYNDHMVHIFAHIWSRA